MAKQINVKPNKSYDLTGELSPGEHIALNIKVGKRSIRYVVHVNVATVHNLNPTVFVDETLAVNGSVTVNSRQTI